MSWKQWVCLPLLIAPLAGVFLACGSSKDQRTPGSERQSGANPGTILYLHRWVEPREHAFTVLLPQGWIAEGGVLRLDPRLGPTNSVGAKIDFAVKKDKNGSVMIHWFPNFTYKDPRALPGGMFPVGSNYMGSTVYPVPDPQTFLTQFVFHKQRPRAQNVKIVERKPLPDAVQQYQKRAVPNARYEAASMTVVYDEGGVHYQERLEAVIEFIAGQGLGMWTNHGTTAIRAPAAEFDKSMKLCDVIGSSLQGNPQWVAAENHGAGVRAHQALQTQRYLQDQRHQMVERQREVNAEARHSNWLSITGQDDYVNPHTGEVEQGSNEYQQRWVNSSGDVIYSDNPDYDPSRDSSLQGRTDFKLSSLRPR
jgi:hypothetical protein